MSKAATLVRPTPEPHTIAIDAVLTGLSGDPFAVLGPHREASGLVRVNVHHPDVDQIEAVDRTSGVLFAKLDKADPRGFFTTTMSADQASKYKLRLTKGSHAWETEDTYRFPSRLGELDLYLLGEGNDRRAHDKLGAHALTMQGVAGVAFAVWAPNATRASVIGPFNDWDGRRHLMRKHPGVGIWDLFIPGLAPGDLYKYEFLGQQGQLLSLKADPYGQAHETPPATASRVPRAEPLEWHDGSWMSRRAVAQSRSAPISIYEVHLGSWRRGAGDSQLDYDQVAGELIPYVRDLGFTHIELMPIAEYPFGGSWGYQPIGMFSPTSRFGPPEAFARFVDQFHEAGIGVLLDWVPAHFPNDEHGLVRFDGTALYEHEDPRRGFHKDWNTLIYNYGRREVANFLQSNALFWLERYHLDGLRVDAVASMLYLDYSRKSGEWVPNEHGGRENLEAIRFLQSLNTRVYGDHPGAITVAEESTAWPQVSRPVDHGGLGFGFKWNMGWMHDTLKYISEDPINRRHHHDKMTFGLLYAWDENFILPISHDEVVHGKGSLLSRMPGDQWQRFANLRAYLGFMWTHPGKKLLFMGCEFGQEREWQHDHSLDWHLLEKPEHKGVQGFVRDLNAAYRSIPALHELDCEPSGFQWIDGGNANDSVLAYLRKGEGDAAPALVICNFTPVVRHDYRVGVPVGGRWTERLNSDSIVYGGSGVGLGGAIEADAVPHHGQPFTIRLTLPPLATLVLTAPTGRGAAA